MIPTRTLLALAAALALAAPTPAQSVDTWVDAESLSPAEALEVIRRDKDQAPRDVFVKAAELRTEAALDELLGLLERGLRTQGSRVGVTRALVEFEGVGGFEKRALDTLLGIAGDSEDSLLREAAVEALGDGGGRARLTLEMIVDSDVEQELRVRALELHAEEPSDADLVWYRELVWPSADYKGAATFPELREVAFPPLVEDLGPEELDKAVQDGRPSIRRLALLELAERDPAAAAEEGRRAFNDSDQPFENRMVGARVLAAHGGTDVLEQLVEIGGARTTSMRYREGLAEIVADAGDPGVQKQLEKRVGRAKDEELLFVARALVHTEDDRASKGLRRLIDHREQEVRLLGIELAVEREDVEAIEDLADALEDCDEPIEAAPLVDALDALHPDDAPAFEAFLVERVVRELELPEARSAALAALARRDATGHQALFAELLDDEAWSTRYAAIAGLEAARTPEALALLVAALDGARGRDRLVLTDALWRLTGRPFGLHVERWQRWWKDVGGSAAPVPPQVVAELEAERAAAAEDGGTGASFFGLELVSERIIFVVDVSGSMEERIEGTMASRTGGGTGLPHAPGETRHRASQVELVNALQQLEPTALFNIIAFSDVVRPWHKSLERSRKSTREDAVDHVEDLRANGGTNLFDSLELAFSDPDVDTIYVLSDGEPTAGRVDDPAEIRAWAQRWNEGRGVVVHTIAIGPDLAILRHLAEDSGGQTLHIP